MSYGEEKFTTIPLGEHEIRYRRRSEPGWVLSDAYAVVQRPGKKPLILGPYREISLEALSAKAAANRSRPEFRIQR